MVHTRVDMDNGYFPLAKDALKVLAKTKLSGGHRAIIDVIWLETYGWYDESSQYEQKIKKRKTAAQIPSRTFEDETCMDKSSVSRIIKDLVQWKIILRDKNTNPITYSFNVNVDQWESEVFRNTTVYRSIHRLQDNKQLTIQSTESLQNSQQPVDYTVNSLQLESQELPGFEAGLNNIKEISKEIIYKDIFDHWNGLGIIKHEKLTDEFKKAIDKALKKNSPEEIKQAMSRYELALHDKTYKYCDYKWSITSFLNQGNGYTQFLDEGDKWRNYQDKRGSPGGGEVKNNGRPISAAGRLDGSSEKTDRLALRRAQCKSNIRNSGDESG